MKRQMSPKAIHNLLFTAFLLTVLFTLLSGAGTYCAAFKTEQYPRMSALLPYQWLYQILVVVSVSIGLWGVWEVIAFLRRKTDYQRRAIMILSLGLFAGTIQMVASEILRGTSIPVNFRVYVTFITLLLFLFIRVTPLGQRIGFSQLDNKQRTGAASLGTALFMSGILTLATPFWVGSSHFSENGYNWVNDLKGYLLLFGGIMVFSGVVFLGVAIRQKLKKSSYPISTWQV